jgi:uncharacterized protein
MAVHVSIHDVSPAWEREVDDALELAHAASVKPALLVVPDFHGRAPLVDHPRYVDRLRKLQTEGHEIYLHGYYHRARALHEHDETSRPSRARYFFAQRVVSGGEAEFSDLSMAEAAARLDAGERMLRDAGLAIDGFVAPAWSMPRGVLGLLGERGYGYTEDHLRVYDPVARSARPSLVLNFASRTPLRLLSTALYCRLARPARRMLPTRIAIHPADMRFLLLRREVGDLLAWASGDFVERGKDLVSPSSTPA